MVSCSEMKSSRIIISFFVLAVMLLGCTGGGSPDLGEGGVAQPSDTLYTQEAAMEAYASDPDRALLIIDSAEIVGNMSDVDADVLRAKVYSWSCEEMNYDTAILIGERLMQHKTVVENADLQEDVLEILLNACRLRKDYEQALHWATVLGGLYLSRGETTEALRNDAEIGTLLIRIGQQEEGFAKVDSVVGQLEGKRKFNEMDAMIVALKRKAEICIEKERFADVIPVARHMLDLLDDFEHHAESFHDGTVREPSEDERPEYIDFYRGKAYGYLSAAYANSGESAKAREFLALYDQTFAGHSLTGRFMIAPTLRKLGEYDRVWAVYDEVEQQLGTDTLNANYVEILRGRAEILNAQGLRDASNAYWKRYAVLDKQLTENMLQGKAHLYAARFRALDQQREIERKTAHIRTTHRIMLVVVLVLLMTIAFSVYTLYQKRQLVEKNAVMVKLIDEREAQNRLLDSVVEGRRDDFALFSQMENRIRAERLYTDQGIQRNELAEIIGMKPETISQLVKKFAGGVTIPTYLNEIRFSEACKILREQPEVPIYLVADQVGLNSRSLQRLFHEQYGMSPSEYREFHQK